MTTRKRGRRTTTWAWTKYKQDFKARCKAAHQPCWLCHQPIKYDAPPLTKDAFELDHAVPVSQRPDLEYDPANARPSHSSCNRRRQAKAAPRRGWQPANW